MMLKSCFYWICSAVLIGLPSCSFSERQEIHESDAVAPVQPDSKVSCKKHVVVTTDSTELEEKIWGVIHSFPDDVFLHDNSIWHLYTVKLVMGGEGGELVVDSIKVEFVHENNEAVVEMKKFLESVDYAVALFEQECGSFECQFIINRRTKTVSYPRELGWYSEDVNLLD